MNPRPFQFRPRIAAAVLALLLPLGAQASSYGAMLREADAVRTSDPVRFGRLLAELGEARSNLSPAEARYLRLLQDYQKALRGDYGGALGDAVALYDQTPEPEIRFRAGLLVANVAAITRDFNLGLRYLEGALDQKEQVREPEVRHLGYIVAATLYNQYGQHDLGKRYAELILAQSPTPRSRCFARQLRFEALHALKRPLQDEAVTAAISDCLAQREVIIASLIRATLAQSWIEQGKLRQAIGLLEGVLPDAEATGYTRLIGEIRGLLARSYLDLGELRKAEAHAESIIRLDGKSQNWSPLVIAHRVLYEAALQRRDTATALHQYRLYAEAEKAQLDEIKAREYAFQLSRHEIRQKNQSISLLSNQNQLLRLQQEVAERSAWNFRLAIALLLVLAGSLGYWVWRSRSTHRSLRQLAETDGLTGLCNRRHFRARSEFLLAAAAPRRMPMALLLMDLDHFKQINDQCGHSAGDWVLREVARVGRGQCREADLYGRIGGEEFGVLLVDCDIDDAVRIAEGLRRAIAAIDALATGCPLPVSASIGVVGTAQSGYDYEALMAHADAAMYRSKVAGRNRVTLYEAPPVPARGAALREGQDASTLLREY